MMTTRGGRRLATAAAACVLGLAVAACGGDDTGGSDSSDSESEGPLAEFFGWDDQARLDGGEEFSEEERQQHYELQDLVVACMSEAGFEYTPEPFYGDTDEGAWEDPFEEVWQLQQDDPEAFAREYGYGMTTIDYEGVEDPEPERTDPNWEYQESLSDAAREEYDKALWGDWSEYEEALEDGEEIEEFEGGGCWEEASQEVYNYGNGAEETEQFDDLLEEWDTLYERTENDPRLTEAKQAWSGCMADAGHPGLTDLYDAQGQVEERQSELYGWDQEEFVEEGDGGSGGELAAQPDPSPSFEPVEPDPAELAELRTFEREIALADYQCRQEHDVDELERNVRFEHEAEFIENNREELEAYRDWINEQESVG